MEGSRRSEMPADLDRAIRELKAGGGAFVLVKDGEILGTGGQSGIRELLALADHLRTRARGAALADRVIGRAAALVAGSMRLSSAHAGLLSEPGRRALLEAGIEAHWGRLVPAILDRSGDGPCPLEAQVAGTTDPGEAIDLLRSFVGLPRP